MRRSIIAALLLTVASWLHAAQLGPPRRVGPIGTAPAVTLLGTVLPFGDGHVTFTSQPMPNQTTLYNIVATPIDHSGVVQYDKAKILVTGVSSAPLAAATDSGYLLCWTVQKDVFTVALSPSLEPLANHVNSLGQVIAGRLACNGSSCLLTTALNEIIPEGNSSLITLGADGVPKNHIPLLRPGYAYQSSLAPVKSGYAFAHGGTSSGTYAPGITWLDNDGNVIAETPLPGWLARAPAIAVHPAGALVIGSFA